MSVFEGVMIGSEAADWWEKRNKEYHEELEQYVLENPGIFGIAVATTKATAADFAMVMWVDLARLGEGAAQGGVKGIVQDVFRVLNFVPQGKVLQGSKTLFGRAVQTVANLKVWRNLDGGLCVPISIAQALQRGGHRIGVSLAEVANALGIPLVRIFKEGVKTMAEIEAALIKLGLQVSRFDGAAYNTFNALKTLAGRQPGPLLVPITAADGAGHVILVGKTLKGVKIIDRYGVFNSLDDLAKHYGRGAWTIDADSIFCIANAVIDDSLLHLVNQSGVLAALVRTAVAVFDLKESREKVDADFEKFLERKGKKKPVVQGPAINIVGGFTVEVVAGRSDRATLSGIAKAHYGEFNLWPLIYDLNKDKIGPNPNRLRPGTKLLLLPLETYTLAERATARKRASTWKNYA